MGDWWKYLLGFVACLLLVAWTYITYMAGKADGIRLGRELEQDLCHNRHSSDPLFPSNN